MPRRLSYAVTLALRAMMRNPSATLASVAGKHGVSLASLRRAARAAGMPARRAGRPAERKIKEG